jgi:hypothetical protein
MSPILKFTRHRIFGWEFFSRALPAGYKYSIDVPVDTDYAAAKMITYWVAGSIKSTEDTRGRSAGDITDFSIKVPAGKHGFVVDADTKWWCTTAKANGNILPEVSKTIIEAGDTAAFGAGTLLFLAEGEFKVNNQDAIKGPKTYKIVSEDVQITAVTKTYGLVFIKEK